MREETSEKAEVSNKNGGVKLKAGKQQHQRPIGGRTQRGGWVKSDLKAKQQNKANLMVARIKHVRLFPYKSLGGFRVDTGFGTNAQCV